MKNVFITGVSSGLGNALSEKIIEKGNRVLGISRTSPENIKDDLFRHISVDLADLENIVVPLQELFSDIEKIDLVILNAGTLGDLKGLRDTSIESVHKVMDINVWSNKVILDFLMSEYRDIEQVVAISSGASVNASAGWGGYSVSKASLNTLIKLYSNEFPNTHFTSLAPGLVATPMLNHIIETADRSKFPSIERIINSRKFTPGEAAENIIEKLNDLVSIESGSYVDIRSFKDITS